MRTVHDLVRRQWDALVWWLEAADVARHRGRPSGLAGWEVGELVAHLALGLGMVTEVRGAPPGTASIGLARYLAGFPPAAEAIAAETRRLAAGFGDALVPGVVGVGAAVWEAELPAPGEVVLGRRGPVTFEEFLRTRLLELVVHADDLVRALPGPAPRHPVLAEAADDVAALLEEVYGERTGRTRPAGTTWTWIRTACGRTPSADSALPLL